MSHTTILKQHILCEISENSDKLSSEMVDKILYEFDEEQIHNAYHKLMEHSSTSNQDSVMGILMFSPMGWAAWRLLKAATDKHMRQCGIFKISNRREQCIFDAKIKDMNQRIAILTKEKSKSDKKKIDKIDKKIKKYKEYIEKYEDKKQMYKDKNHLRD